MSLLPTMWQNFAAIGREISKISLETKNSCCKTYKTLPNCRSGRPKNTRTRILGIQGRLRSSMLIPPESSSLVLVMIISMSVHTCNLFYTRRANNGTITTIGDSIPLFDAFVRKKSLYEILSQKS